MSNFVKQLLADRGIPADHIGIVPPMAVSPTGIDAAQEPSWQALQEARARVRGELGFDEQDIVVGCVAVLREPKGHAELLQAMVPLCKANPRLHLVVVGDGQAVMQRLQATCAEHDLQRQVHLLGFRSDASQLMPGFDIFALATHKEASGTVFLEAAQAACRSCRTGSAACPKCWWKAAMPSSLAWVTAPPSPARCGCWWKIPSAAGRWVVPAGSGSAAQSVSAPKATLKPPNTTTTNG